MTATIKHVGNPVTAEIIRNALIAITDEMKTNLMRTAYNPIIYEALDFTVGLFDRNGEPKPAFETVIRAAVAGL